MTFEFGTAESDLRSFSNQVLLIIILGHWIMPMTGSNYLTKSSKGINHLSFTPIEIFSIVRKVTETKTLGFVLMNHFLKILA